MALWDLPVRLNSSHWAAVIEGAGNYRGAHSLSISRQYVPGVGCSWRLVVKTLRLIHVLINAEGVLFLPRKLATATVSANDSTKVFDDAKSQSDLAQPCAAGEVPDWSLILPFAAAALRARWRAVTTWLDAADLLAVVQLNLNADTSSSASLPRQRLLRRLEFAGRARRRVAFDAMARSMQGCYPGVEKISACGRLSDLLVVRVTAALFYGRQDLPRARGQTGKWCRRRGFLLAGLAAGKCGWRQGWFDSRLWNATAGASAAGLASNSSAVGGHVSPVLNVRGLEIRSLAPGVFAFPFFTQHFALQLASEFRSFRKWTERQGMPRANDDPYLTALDEIGGEMFFDARFVRRFLLPLVQQILPEALEDGQLDRAYAFARHYEGARDKDGTRGDGVHHDESTVTVNVALSERGSFFGGNLTFCGVFGSADYRKHVHTLDWSKFPPGVAVLHSGLRRHAAAPLLWGERMNLVLWALNSRPKGVMSGAWETKLVPDPQCLSELYDPDYRKRQHMLRHSSGERCNRIGGSERCMPR